MTSHLSTFERDNVQWVVMSTRAFLKGWNLWDLNEFHSCMQTTLPVLTLGVSFYASQHSVRRVHNYNACRCSVSIPLRRQFLWVHCSGRGAVFLANNASRRSRWPRGRTLAGVAGSNLAAGIDVCFL